MFNWRIFDKKQMVLAIQLVHGEARYLLCQGERVVRAGVLELPSKTMTAGRLQSPEQLQAAIQPVLKGMNGRVAVLLPSDFVHAHVLSLPKGLELEELNYQVTRHITQTLGLPITEVFFDWVPLESSQNSPEQQLLMAVARQSDVLVYGQVFGEQWPVKWVCPECFVWANAFSSMKTKSLVVRVEYGQLSIWHVDGSGQAHYLSRLFNTQMMAQAGFVYQPVTEKGESTVRLPLRFVVDEIVQAVTQWLSAESMRDISVIYGLGRGVDWSLAQTALQQKLGIPVRGVLPESIEGLSSQEDVDGFGGLWHLATQVRS